MGDGNSMMGIGSVVSGGVGLLGGLSRASGIRGEAQYQNAMMESNARLAELQAKDAERRGAIAVHQVQKNAKQVIGAQRAAYAAQGVEIESGSSYEVQQDTKYLSALDAITVMNNARREAWGYRVSANDYLAKGQLALISGRGQAANSLLTGGLGFSEGLLKGASYLGSHSTESGKAWMEPAPLGGRLYNRYDLLDQENDYSSLMSDS